MARHDSLPGIAALLVAADLGDGFRPAQP